MSFRARRACGALLAGSAALLASGPAAVAAHGAAPAAGHEPAGQKAKKKVHWDVTSAYWNVNIGGEPHKVSANATVSLQGATLNEAVESLTPEVTVKTAKPGAYSYGFRLVGPHTAGITGTTVRTFHGRTGVLDTAILPMQFNKLGHHSSFTETGHFVPGTYRLELFVYGSLRHEVALGRTSREKPTFVFDITFAEE